MQMCLGTSGKRRTVLKPPAGLRCTILAIILLLVLSASSTRAQQFNLFESLGPPELDEFTYCEDLIGKLESEIAVHIARERETDAVGQVLLRASVNCRIIAADLLAAGDAAKADGSIAVLYGVTLADGRLDLDKSLQQIAELAKRINQSQGAVNPTVQLRFAESLRLVKLFNDMAVEHAESVRTADAAKLDTRLPMIFAPLGDAIGVLGDIKLGSQWIASAAVQMPAPVIAAAAQPEKRAAPLIVPSITELEKRVETAPVRDDMRTELKSIIDFLRRGDEFPELRPRVDTYQRHVAQVLNLADSLGKAEKWLDQATRTTYDERMKTGVLLFKDPRTRERGQRYIDRLESSRATIDRITLLLMMGESRTTLQPMIRAFLDADAMIENAAQAELGRRQLSELGAVLDRMIEYRELKEIELRRELRMVHRQLQDLYEASEKALLREVGTLSAEPDALADPAFVSLLQDQQQYLEDLLRLRRVPKWVDTMTLVSPKSSGPFYAQARKMTAWLIDSNRRPEAIRAMDQFEEQIAYFYPLPFEDQLSAGSDMAIAATGGMHAQLTRHIHEQRTKWAESWGDGNAASPAAQRMILLYRLTLTMADGAEVLRMQGNASLLNRWSAWQTTDAVSARAISDLPTRLKLATRAAIDGNDDELRATLNRIDDDMPVAKLMGRLTALLGDALIRLPSGGAASTCGQIVYRPTSDSWFVERRAKLADVCRYAIEQEYAGGGGRDKLERSLRRYVHTLANELLEQLGDRRDPLPTLSGFDGSDPMPKEAEESTLRMRKP